jgi:hypothetical protein
VLGALLVSPAAAQDDPNAEAKAAARALANQGFKHAQEGRFDDAIAAFREAEQRFHATTILLELARTHVRAGQLIEARAVYRSIVEEQLTNYAPPDFFEAQKNAKPELDALGPRIPALRIVVEGAPSRDVKVSIDGAPVPGFTGQSFPLNPGRHVIVVTAPGRLPAEREVLLLEGIKQPVVIQLKAPPKRVSSPASRPPPASAGGPRTPVSVEPPEKSGGGSLVPAFVAFGAGGVGLGVGAVAGALALDKVAGLDGRCPDRICEQSDKEDHGAAGTLATVSTVGFIAGGIGVAAGMTLLILRPGGAAPEQTGLVVAPGWIGVRGGF